MIGIWQALAKWPGKDWLVFGAGAVLVAGALVVLVAVLRRLFAPRSARNGRFFTRQAPLKLSRRLLNLLLALLFLFFALSVLLAGSTLRAYQVFTKQERVGVLECLQADPVDQVLVVRFTPWRGPKPGRPQTFTVYGDRWEVSARILKWNGWVNVLGAHTAFRLHHIKGVYLDAADETNQRHQAYTLTPGPDWAWTVAERYGRYLPFIQATYGNAVSSTARPGETFTVYVTTSGLMTQPGAE